MPDLISHEDLDLSSFTITHPEHGTAVCDDRQWPEFKAAGWELVKTSKKAESDKKA